MESKLSPLQYDVPIVTREGTPDPYFIQWLQQLREEKEITDNAATDAQTLAEAALPAADLMAQFLADMGGDPNADRILFWDDSLSAFKFLKVGANLVITGDTIDAAGGSSLPWYGAPPLASAFPTTVTEGAATGTAFADDADLGLCISAAVANNDNLYAKMQTPPAFPFTITAHFTGLTMQGGLPMAGIVLRASSTGLRTIWALDPLVGAADGSLGIRRATGTVFNANVANVNPRSWGNLGYWFRIIVTSATDIVYQASADGKHWGTILANTANGQVVGLNQIGIGFTSRNGANGVATLVCDYWNVA